MAVFDIEQMEASPTAQRFGPLYRRSRCARAGSTCGSTTWQPGTAVAEPADAREDGREGDGRAPSEIERQDGSTVWLHDFGLQFAGAENLNIHDIRPRSSGGLPRGLARRRRERRFQPPGAGAGLVVA